MSQYIVRKSVRIKAEPSKVWEALTSPEKTKKYFYNCEVLSDWKAGSPITFKGKMFLFIPIEMNGKIEKIEPGKFLQYSLKNGKSDDLSAGFSMVTDTLTYENGETVVSIKDDVGGGENAEKRFKRSEKGWHKILSGLKKVVEEQA
ncbi:MAG: hypothetical protein JWO06_592 [Bacteroidota bacterium]|nr:hypothetical protein [Bacteroidota bacterium]